MARVSLRCETCNDVFPAYSSRGHTKCKSCRGRAGPRRCMGCGTGIDRGKRCKPCAAAHEVARCRAKDDARLKASRLVRQKRRRCEGCGGAVGDRKKSTNHLFCNDCSTENLRFGASAHRQPFPFIAAVEKHVRRVEAARAKAPQHDAHVKAWRKRIDKLKAAIEKPWLHPDLSKKERARIRRKLDPSAILYERTKRRLRKKGCNSHFLKEMRRGLLSQTGRAGRGIEGAIGYSMEQLRAHMERQFGKGMSWEKFRQGLIHIDHIRPLNTFDHTNPEEARAAWALSNLRPLWADENLRRPKDGSDLLL